MATLTYAIGDVHGSYTKLVNLVRRCIEHSGKHAFRLIFVGDYVDRGRRSREVVNFLMQAQADWPGQVVCLKGNHEDMLLAAARGEDAALWLENGGDATLRSYGAAAAGAIPAEHLAWFASLPLMLMEEKRFFVHAGIKPGVPLARQTELAMLWIREPFLSDRRDHSRLIVHGHTPLASPVPELRHNRLNLDTGACFGGPLSAAVFDDGAAAPRAFIADDGTIAAAPPREAARRA
jgi:serine/threonine protein phosphatase 1